MPSLSEQPDLLRALGKLLDDERASKVEITFYETFLTASWDKHHVGPQQRSFQEWELQALHREGVALRRKPTDLAMEGKFAEQLRTLGEELSKGAVEASSIVEEDGGFRVAGVSQGKYFQRLFREAELRKLSDERRFGRGGARRLSFSERLEQAGGESKTPSS
ncbi:MAG TPA: hypothetical protein VFC51_04535 [Chloroflexota bacterium]|nr:hypothetical protein [Chloroflexota bacterium]